MSLRAPIQTSKENAEKVKIAAAIERISMKKWVDRAIEESLTKHKVKVT